MVNWKTVSIVILIGILFMLIGLWLGYRYVSEQDEIQPITPQEPSNTETSFVLNGLTYYRLI